MSGVRRSRTGAVGGKQKKSLVNCHLAERLNAVDEEAKHEEAAREVTKPNALLVAFGCRRQRN